MVVTYKTLIISDINGLPESAKIISDELNMLAEEGYRIKSVSPIEHFLVIIWEFIKPDI